MVLELTVELLDLIDGGVAMRISLGVETRAARTRRLPCESCTGHVREGSIPLFGWTSQEVEGESVAPALQAASPAVRLARRSGWDGAGLAPAPCSR